MWRSTHATTRRNSSSAQAALEAARSRRKTADVNVELTQTTATADLDVANAGLKIADSAVVSARTGVDAAISKQTQAQATVASSQAALEQAQADALASGAEATRTAADVKRYEQLFKAGSASSQQYDNAVAAATSAAAKLQSATKKISAARAMIDEAKAGVGVAVEGVNQAKAALAQAEAGVIEAQGRVAQANIVKPRTESSVSQRDAAEADIHQLEENVRQAELQLSYTKIVAPEDGRITKKAVEEGSYLQPGQIVTALVPSEVWVIANFKETQLEYMKPGQEVSVKVDAYGDQAFSAKVDSIQRGSGARFSLLPPENATGNYVKVVQRVPVKIVFDGNLPEGQVFGPGMSVVPTVKVR